MKTRKGSNWMISALFIAVIVFGAYFFGVKKYFGPVIRQSLGGNTTKTAAINPFGNIQKSVNSYGAKVNEEEKSRNEAVEALGQR
jgi:hypothetical protein